ncbi:MAG: 3-dehydroquinate synthase [Bacteroidales bacterium]|nr:3-dehydroquinate synthase [Bacteroidales bacterium]
MKELAAELRKYKQVFVVCDRNVEDFARRIRHDNLLAITADEAHKTIDTVMDICRWLCDCGADRDALVLAVGGGVTTDMAGFAASIYKRGIRYANIPTTLLSMVDAGIGGKTGVNLDGYKNLLGVIRQPVFTAIFPEVLETLPERELRSGLAEMLKTFIIKNPLNAYETAVRLFSADSFASLGMTEKEKLAELIQLAAGIKQDIVEKDEFESGLRRKLNLGHTWAHAIEWWQKDRSLDCARDDKFMTHGEAVAIGMVQAAKYAERHGLAEEPGLADRIAKDLKACGLPTALPCPAEELLPAILKDKKTYGSKIKLVLPLRIGKVAVKTVPSESIAEA